MSKSTVFIQLDGREGLIEAELPSTITGAQLHKSLAALDAETDDATFVFIDEEDEPVKRKGKESLTLRPGTRIHVTRCRKIKVTVNFLEKTAEDHFSPGARVRRVKAWAVDKFDLERQDAAEHVLQLCNSTSRPVSDTPLQQLTDGKRCSVCFDLVPEKRVEG